ncbi:MAG: hypothetical protein ACREHG_10185 [Candidatus Saccharimonadales bacterium]
MTRREELQKEMDALDAEENDDDTEVIVIHGKKGLAKLLAHLGVEDDSEDSDENDDESDDESDNESEDEDEDEPEDSEDKPKKGAKKTLRKKVSDDPAPKSKSRWFD